MTMSEQEEDTEKAGKTMMVLAWVVALAILIHFFGNWEKSVTNPNSQPQSTQNGNVNTVVLQRNRFDHYVLTGFINQQKVTFLLDTGATHVVVPEILAQKLSLEKGRSGSVSTANGNIEVFATRINQLTIGDISLYDVQAAINPYMDGDEILLGMSALKDIEFTQQGDELTLKQFR